MMVSVRWNKTEIYTIKNIKMKHTPVEWLEEELKANLTKIILQYDDELIEDLFTKAKEMEKEQIIEAWNNGYDELDRAASTPYKYYNETYKSE